MKEIWAEVENYVTALFDGIDLGNDEPDDFNGEALPSDTSAQAFSDLLAGDIVHAATLVAQSAQRACAKLILCGNVEMQQAVQKLLAKDDRIQERALFMMEALAMIDPATIVAFRTKITGLTHSRNFAIRRSATRISNRLGWEVSAQDTSVVRLPPVYDFVLPPPLPDFLDEAELRPEFVLPDTRNARELILPFDLQFHALADVSRVPRVNIYYRAVQIMEELAPRETWNAQSEDRLRAILASAGLKFSFRRPRALLARRALFYLTAELLDTGRIGTAEIAQLEPLLTFDDPILLLIEPARRPDEVPPIPRGEKYSERNEQWLERIEETRQLGRPNLENGWRVIAENTTLKILDWEVPTETRRSVVCPSDAVAPKEELLTKIPPCQIDAYWDIDVSRKAGSLAIQNDAYMYNTIGANWIGFNPKVARDLGWRPGTESMLSWEDGSGRILAKTIWWADGTIQHYPPVLNDEIGEGWLVVVSPGAWEVLNRRFTTLVRVGRIERQFNEEKKERRKTLDYIDLA